METTIIGFRVRGLGLRDLRVLNGLGFVGLSVLCNTAAGTISGYLLFGLYYNVK